MHQTEREYLEQMAVDRGDPLPCCGCEFHLGPEESDCECHCHETVWRFARV